MAQMEAGMKIMLNLFGSGDRMTRIYVYMLHRVVEVRLFHHSHMTESPKSS